ncbi:MAG: prolipoprotein diacylglyceryl transferase family protein [Candidatus Promineifilaceae bacterium]
MYPLLQLGPVAIQVPGLILVLATWLGLSLSEKEAVRQKRPPEPLFGLVMTGVISGILGAKLWYVGHYLDTYLADPLGIFSVNGNTFDAMAGMVIGAMAGIIYSYRKKLPLRSTLDMLTPGLAIFSVGLGLSHLASGDAFGAVTEVPWAINLWDAQRHPTQIYEIILALIALGFVWRLRQTVLFRGFLFLSWLSLTAVSRLFLEAFRGDSIIVAGSIRQAQLVALTLLLISLWLMRQWYQPLDKPGKEQYANK